MLRIDRRRLGEWLEHAALLHVREIDGRTASILHEAGIRDLEMLADREPAEVVASFMKVSRSRKGPVRELPEEEAGRWIDTARTFLRRESHVSAEPAPS
jgi:hypothetical protein